MPIKIIDRQRRFAEQGRIRLGHKASNGAPVKLQSFRFTSTSEQHIKDLAALYGGTPQPWDNNGKPEHEVFTDTKSIPVIAVKGGLSQWLEFWSGGGCIHRCDGETNVLTGEPCDLDEQVQAGRKRVNPHTEAKPTTRLSLMLPELESIGVWRLESHGWNAAVEIPAVAELAQFVGDLVPASLDLVERRAIKDGKTSRFVVPVLDLKIATHRLRELVEAKVNGGALPPAAPGSAPAALTAAPSSAGTPAEDPFHDYFSDLEDVASLEALTSLWESARHERLVGSQAQDTPRAREFVAAWKAKAHALKPPEPAAQPDEDGAFPIDVVDEQAPDADAVWDRVVKAAGSRGMTLEQLNTDFTAQMGGLLADEATPAELLAYLGKLEEVPAA